jgi:hypothetical protein
VIIEPKAADIRITNDWESSKFAQNNLIVTTSAFNTAKSVMTAPKNNENTNHICIRALPFNKSMSIGKYNHWLKYILSTKDCQFTALVYSQMPRIWYDKYI